MSLPFNTGSEVVALSVGANIGPARDSVLSAVSTIAEDADIIMVDASSLYLTAPVGKTDQADFVNCAVTIRTVLSPEELIVRLLAIERSFGRAKRQQWFPRELDLDIVLYGMQIIDTPDLIIPHPRMHVRRFVLEPLSEIAPMLIHPVLNQDVATLLSLCQDPSAVRRIESD